LKLAGTGWNGVLANHTGQYLGVPASGRRIGVNGLVSFLNIRPS
jgi:hypothetical protein